MKMEILGVYDRVLTDKEIQKIHAAGEEGIRKSLADTQPVKVYDDTGESMPFSVAYCLEEWAKESE
jgi:hypothetical protein